MIYFIFAFFYGTINVVNKMVNVQAKKNLGISSGTLLNYVEATVITMVIILISERTGFIVEQCPNVPPLYYFGGVFSVCALILIILGTERTKVTLSTTMVLAGQLTVSVIMDAVFFDRFSIYRVAGIVLILLGSLYDHKYSK